MNVSYLHDKQVLDYLRIVMYAFNSLAFMIHIYYSIYCHNYSPLSSLLFNSILVTLNHTFIKFYHLSINENSIKFTYIVISI